MDRPGSLFDKLQFVVFVVLVLCLLISFTMGIL